MVLGLDPKVDDLNETVLRIVGRKIQLFVAAQEPLTQRLFNQPERNRKPITA